MSNEKTNAILYEIRKLARELPSGQRDAIINKCNRVQLLAERYRKDTDVDPAEESEYTERNARLFWPGCRT